MSKEAMKLALDALEGLIVGREAADCYESNKAITALQQALAEQPAPVHPDDAAVDRFAAAMKEKLVKAREKGRGGWETCPPEDLSRMLREHVEKGDPRDVANFAMMLWTLDAGITVPVQQEPCCHAGIAHDCHAGPGCRIVKRLKAAPQPAQQEPLISKDAYDGAREDLAIWKKRALESEAKLRAQPAQRTLLPKGEWPKHPSKYVGEAYVGYSTSDLDCYAMQVLAAHGFEVQP